MAANLSDFLEVKLLEHSVGEASWTMPSVYLALFTTPHSEAGTGGTEVSGGSYARQSIPNTSWASAVSGAGTITTSVDILFPVASGAWGTLTDMAIYDAVTVGNMLWFGPLTASKVIGNGDQFKIVAGQIVLTLS